MRSMPDQRGITKLEFTVVCILFAIFIATFLNSVRYYQEEVERLMVQQNILQMQTAQLIHLTSVLTSGTQADLEAMVGANPVIWLDGPPAKYLGEYKELSMERVTPGSWFFDTLHKQLVYIVNISSRFKRLDDDAARDIRWQLVSESKDGKVNATTLRLKLITAYEWE